jgi:tripartite-type tricarboxylate transporter receptor subunit TctC
MQPTRLVVPTEEGTSLDRVARMAAGLSEGPLGTSIFVDRRPGGGGTVAWRDVAGQKPDGHQLAYVTEGLLARGGSGADASDFEMVAQTDTGSAVLVVPADPEAESFQDKIGNLGGFVRTAEEGPGLVEVADAGPGTVYRAGTLALERSAGIDLTPRSLGKNAAAQALYDGDVEAALVPTDEVLVDVWAGELRALAVLGDERSADLPNVPTARELGYGVAVPVFGGIATPAGTPRETVDELGRAFGASTSSRAFAHALVGTAREPLRPGPKGFAAYVNEQAKRLSGTAPEAPDERTRP